MSIKNALIVGLFAILILPLFAGCKSTVDQITMSTCKVVETNIAKCSRMIADDISGKNSNTLSSVNEGDL